MMNMQVYGLVEAASGLERLPFELQSQLTEALTSTMQQTLGVMDTLTPVDTGYLVSRNTATITEANAYRVAFEVTNDATYAGYVAFGTYKMTARDFVTPAIVFGQAYLASYIARLRFGV